MIHFLFSKTFNVVNDKQPVSEYFLITMEPFRQRVNCRIHHTIHD